MNSCNVCGISCKQCCVQCRKVYYCSVEHQKSDWKKHKLSCLASKRTTTTTKANETAAIVEELARKKRELEEMVRKMQEDAEKCRIEAEKAREELAAAQHRKEEAASAIDQATSTLYSSEGSPAFYLAEHLEKNGYAYLDGFIGADSARRVREAVLSMWKRGRMRKSELAGGKKGQAMTYVMERVRGDVVRFLGGEEVREEDEEGGEDEIERGEIALVKSVLRKIDEVCQTLLGVVGELNGMQLARGKMMVAIYPGNGARYVKHVDNPDGNGRRITTILYLNDNWQPGDGGELRIFPQGVHFERGTKEDLSKPVDIAPLLDRFLCFFSDHRNPHEVLPANKDRIALTTWFFDSEERQRALMEQTEEDCERHRIELEIKRFEAETGTKATRIERRKDGSIVSDDDVDASHMQQIINEDEEDEEGKRNSSDRDISSNVRSMSIEEEEEEEKGEEEKKAVVIKGFIDLNELD